MIISGTCFADQAFLVLWSTLRPTSIYQDSVNIHKKFILECYKRLEVRTRECQGRACDLWIITFTLEAAFALREQMRRIYKCFLLHFLHGIRVHKRHFTALLSLNCSLCGQVMSSLGDTPIVQIACSATTAATAPIAPDVPLPSMPGRWVGHTLFCHAVTSLLSQRLLHKMANSRSVWIARLHVR